MGWNTIRYGVMEMWNLESRSLLALYNQWAEQNQGWSYLIQGVFLIFPTWLFFRNSPRHRHHTLPEGFFLQAFISSLMLLLDALGDFMDQWVGLLILVYIYFIYHRIFGFRLWGTLWRTALSLFFSIFTVFIIIVGIEVIYDCIRSAGIG